MMMLHILNEVIIVKVWFFKSKGCYEAMIEMGGYMTFGTTLAETIYMAHDLIACIIDDEDCNRELITDFMTEWKDLEGDENAYAGYMDIDVDFFGQGGNSGWVRKGDLAPAKNQSARFVNMRRAFEMTYRNYELSK